MTVQFDARSTPGVLPPLRIVGTNVTGSVWAVNVAIVRNGSTDWLYAPIPADMLNAPTRLNNSVQVRHLVDIPQRSGSCVWQYLQVYLPCESCICGRPTDTGRVPRLLAHAV